MFACSHTGQLSYRINFLSYFGVTTCKFLLVQLLPLTPNMAFVPSSFVPQSAALLRAPTTARPHTTTPTASLTRRAAITQLPLAALALALPSFLPARVNAGAQENGAAARDLIRAAIARDPTLAGTFLRASFHDAFPQAGSRGGANGSLRFEVRRGENFGLKRAVDILAEVVEKSGLGWADAFAVAGAVAVEETGGPRISVKLGRVDAEEGDPTGILPGFDETVVELRNRFEPRGYDDRDLVALSGAHTLGRSSNGVFVKESNKFRNDYFINLMWFQERRELGESEKVGPPDRPNFQLPSDVHLLDSPKTLEIVREFAADQNAFFEQFKKSYIKMTEQGAKFA